MEPNKDVTATQNTPYTNTTEPVQASTSVTTRTYTHETADPPLDSAKLLGIAGAAAGGIAGLLVLMSERGEGKDDKDARRKAESARKDAETAKNDLVAYLRAKRDEAVATADDRSSDLASTLSQFRSDAEKEGKKASKKGKKAKKEAASTLEDFVQQLKAKAEEASDVASHKADDAAALLSSARADAGKEADKAARKAKKATKEAKSSAKTFSDILKEKINEYEDTGESYMNNLVIPALRTLTKDAKSKSAELIDKAEHDLIPQAQTLTHDLKDKVEHDLLPQAQVLTHDLKDKAAETAKTVRDNAEPMKAEASAKIADAATTAQVQAKDAGDAVKRGTKETRSLLMWLALAGILIFGVFLDEEQQKRMKEIATELFGEAREMYADMKGEETTKY